MNLIDRDSMIAQMHSCEQSDHSAKLSRDVESLGHHGTYETETAIKMLKASASPTPTGLEILERNCFFLEWTILEDPKVYTLENSMVASLGQQKIHKINPGETKMRAPGGGPDAIFS